MADFRKVVPVLAVLALILGLSTTASAQQVQAFTCVANSANPQTLRFEGLTELVGDLVIQCTGGIPTAPGVPIPQANITVFMGNTTVTSRLISSSTRESEEVLMLDEPMPDASNGNPQVDSVCTTPASGCTGPGDGKGGFGPVGANGLPTFTYYGTGTGLHPSIYKGNIYTFQPNAVTWLGVPIDPPGSNGTRTIRISNIRINANALGVGTETSPPVQAQAFISVTPPTALPISNNAQQVVGYVQRGLDFALRNSANDATITNVGFLQCVSQSDSFVAWLRFQERFAAAFKRRNTAAFIDASTSPTPVPQNIPGQIYGTETGFYAPAALGAVTGLADFGTRLKAVFNNVPLGVTLKVTAVNSGWDATNVARLTSSEAGAFSAVGAVGDLVTVSMTTSGTVQSGQAVWEVLGDNQQAFNTMYFGLSISYTANPGGGSPGLGTATVSGSFAPVSTERFASTSAPIPRFADTSSPINLLTISVCATNLLFPFVTNQVGFYTGMAIANTSQDIFGTVPQTGVCTLNSFGTNAPAAITTPSIAGGTVYTALASAAMPNFQGYVIARCTFQFAHGFAFVSDLGARNLAMGYLALIIPDKATRRADPLGALTNTVGEQLGN